MKFPITIRHRESRVKIYAPAKNFSYYRIAFYTAGKRQMQPFPTYGEARTAADRIVREISRGSTAASLTAPQAQDALSARERLTTLFQSTGRKFTLLGAVAEFADAIARLGGRSLREAVDGYLSSVATVKPYPLADAVEDFIASRAPRAQARPGQRPALAPRYVVNFNNALRAFAATFPGTAVCDLTKAHLDTYIQTQKQVGVKSRNDRRAHVKMFLSWAARQDYLPAHHRLFESEGMTRERLEPTETDYYRPPELRAMLALADAELRPALLLGGLAGLRQEEITRLEWCDVWRVPNEIEVSASKAKTRQRRMVRICPALAEWLEPYRHAEGRVYPPGGRVLQHRYAALRQAAKIPPRRNGLRHAFCTYHFALHRDENRTAAQAGNTPAMIHRHYKGLAPQAEAEAWFSIKPE